MEAKQNSSDNTEKPIHSTLILCLKTAGKKQTPIQNKQQQKLYIKKIELGKAEIKIAEFLAAGEPGKAMF